MEETFLQNLTISTSNPVQPGYGTLHQDVPTLQDRLHLGPENQGRIKSSKRRPNAKTLCYSLPQNGPGATYQTKSQQEQHAIGPKFG